MVKERKLHALYPRGEIEPQGMYSSMKEDAAFRGLVYQELRMKTECQSAELGTLRPS